MSARATIETRRSQVASLQVWASYGLFVAVAALLVASFAAPSFRVSHVSVRGAPQAQSEIQAATGVVGANIFTMNAAKILDAVWRVPNVLPCGVTLSFPSTVTVCAHMRVPVIGWQTQNRLYLVDKYGRITGAAATTSLPILRDTTHVIRHVGADVDPWVVESAMWVLSQMRRADIAGFTLGEKHGLIVRSAHHWKAYLGLPQDSTTLARRVATLKALIGHGFHIGHPLAFADLTGSSSIIVRFHGLSTSNGGIS